jgi:hypothetical protein
MMLLINRPTNRNRFLENYIHPIVSDRPGGKKKDETATGVSCEQKPKAQRALHMIEICPLH